MKFHYCEQRSDEWHKLRAGKITGTLFKSVMGRQESTWIRLKNELENGSTFQGNESTDWGQHYEPTAESVFSFVSGLDIEHVGFIVSDIEHVGFSPDGIIRGQKKGIEIKCPFKSKNHLKFLESKKVPSQYRWQVQGALMVTGYESWYFVSYDPRQPIDKQMEYIEVRRNEQEIDELKERIEHFTDWWKYFGKYRSRKKSIKKLPEPKF